MERPTKITYTKKFLKDYPYSYDGFDHFMRYWMYPFLDKVYDNRTNAYSALNEFITHVKSDFKHDYGNYILPNICEDWFKLVDYKESEDEY